MQDPTAAADTSGDPAASNEPTVGATEDAALHRVVFGQRRYFEERCYDYATFDRAHRVTASAIIRSDSQQAARWPGTFSSKGG